MPADPAVGGWANFACRLGLVFWGSVHYEQHRVRLALAMQAPCSPAAGSPTPVDGHVVIPGHSIRLGQFAHYTRTQRAEFDLNEFFAERVHPRHLQDKHIAGGWSICTNFEDSKKKIFQIWE